MQNPFQIHLLNIIHQATRKVPTGRQTWSKVHFGRGGLRTTKDDHRDLRKYSKVQSTSWSLQSKIMIQGDFFNATIPFSELKRKSALKLTELLFHANLYLWGASDWLASLFSWHYWTSEGGGGEKLNEYSVWSRTPQCHNRHDLRAKGCLATKSVTSRLMRSRLRGKSGTCTNRWRWCCLISFW